MTCHVWIVQGDEPYTENYIFGVYSTSEVAMADNPADWYLDRGEDDPRYEADHPNLGRLALDRWTVDEEAP